MSTHPFELLCHSKVFTDRMLVLALVTLGGSDIYSDKSPEQIYDIFRKYLIQAENNEGQKSSAPRLRIIERPKRF